MCHGRPPSGTVTGVGEEPAAARAATMSHHEELRPRTFEELFARYERDIGQFLAQVVHSRPLAEDLLQETFLAAFRSRDHLESVPSVRAWLYGIARNRALHELRARRRRRATYERLRRARGDDATDPADAVMVRDFLTRHLKPEERLLVVLRYIHGFDATELASMTGASPEAIRKRLSRARARLVEAIEKEEGR